MLSLLFLLVADKSLSERRRSSFAVYVARDR